MIAWTWESPQTWIALTAAVLGPLAWVWVTWLKTRVPACSHEWEAVGARVKVFRGNGDRITQPARCLKCGEIRAFEVSA